VDAVLQSLGTPGPAFLAVAGLLALAVLIGEPCLRGRAEHGVARLVLATVIGLDVLALLFFLLAWSGGLEFVPLRALFGLAMLGALALAVRRRAWSFSSEGSALVLLTGVFALVALAYPFSWDDLVYQVAVPMRWRESGGLPVFSDNPYSGFPSAFAVLNLVLVRAGGILGPGLFNAALWGLLLALLWARMAPRIGRAGASSFALAFGLAWPVVMEAMSAYAELFLALQLLALAWLVLGAREERRAPRTGELLALGFLSASAAAIKLTGVSVPCLSGLWVFAGLRGAPRERLRRMALFLAPLLLVLAPFYARPWLATQNPLHPYFAQWFTSDAAALLTSRYHHDAGTARFGVPLTASLATLGQGLVAPLQLALGPFGDLARFDGLLGLQFAAWFLALLALAFAVARRRARVAHAGLLAAGAAALYGFWFLTSQQTRFLIPAAALIPWAAAEGLELCAPRGRPWLAAALPLLALVSIPVRTYEHIARAFSVHLGRTTRFDYLESANPDRYLQACQAILERTPSDARVLLLFEQRGLYVPRAHVIGTPYFQAALFTPPERAKTAADWLASVRALGITHVLVGYNVYDPDRMDAYLERTRAFQELLVAMRGRELEVLFELRENESGEVRHGLYRLRAP
jgi:hypothetical protein